MPNEVKADRPAKPPGAPGKPPGKPPGPPTWAAVPTNSLAAP